jgi:PKD repeat protein
MISFLRFFGFLVSIVSICCLSNPLEAQSFSAEIEPKGSLALSKIFSNFQVFRFDAATLGDYVKSNAEAPAQLKIGGHDWKLELTPNPILSENYLLTVQTAKGVSTTYPKHNIAFKGYELNGGGRVRLTLNGEFLYGFVEEGNERFYVEPLWYFEPDAAKDLFVIYPKSAVSAFPTDACGVTQEQIELQHLEDGSEKEPANGIENSGCYAVEIAIASDALMLSKYGSVPAVENHNIGVLNDVQVDYTGNFTHDIEFLIVTQFVTSNDPWTQSTDAGTLLGSFQTWGNAGNFGVSFDVGELWTNRDFNGGTIGIAYLNGICNDNKYHCLQDFTNNPEFLRVLTSHELGHNFSSGHDAAGSPFIMAPAVQNTNQWSQQSTDAINNYTQIKINSGCLGACGPPPPPLIAGFDWLPKPGCQNQTVTFSDLSSGNITSWAWNFPGGTPAASSLQNPTVTWNLPGIKNVKLTINGVGGSNSITQQVEILPAPVANFTFSVNKYEVTFVNGSVNATSYDWDFGDGENSNEENPVHTYNNAGTYLVVLTATSQCGTSTKAITVNTAPKADFRGSPIVGCAPLTVQMTNLSSSNAVTYVWSFPGGVPATSNQTNPSVVYALPGTYSVSLKATNFSGSDTIIRVNYIKVKTKPTAKFTSAVNDVIATFTNTSTGDPNSYFWSFGDGDTSIVANPVHTYANSGTYEVILTATNECGSSSDTMSVVILSTLPPNAVFSASPSIGCISYNPVPAYDHIVVVVGGKANSDPVFGNSNAPFINSLANNGAKFINSNGVFDPSQPNYLALYSGSDQGVTNDNPITSAFTSANLGRALIDAQKSYATYSEGLPSVGFDGPVNGNYSRIHNPAANWMGGGTNQIPATSNQPFTAFPINFDSLPNVAFVIPDQCSGGHDVCPPLNNSVKQFDSWIQNNLDAYKQWCVDHNSLLIVTYDENAYSGTNKIATVIYGAHVENGVYNQSIDHYNVLRTIEEANRLSVHAGAAANALPIENCWTPEAPSLTVKINNNSTGASSYLWHFPGGSPDTSLLANPTVKYSTPGIYTATLIATNSNGSDTIFTTITVNTLPTPGFSYSVFEDTSITFTNYSAGATSYLWTFGDGDSSAIASPVHDYPSLDSIVNYTVIMQAINDCGTVSDTQMVTVITDPKAKFTASVNAGCAPLSVQFSNTSSSNATSFDWQFPGGNPSSSTAQTPPLVEYSVPGTYTVTLTASNVAGSSTATQSVIVTGGPSAGFTSTVSLLTATFNNTTSNGISYHWDFGDGGSSTDAGPTHVYAADGTYTVVLTATNNCGTSTFTQNVIITTAPGAGFSVSTTSGCAVLSVNFTDISSGSPVSWAWSFPGGTPASSSDQNPTVQYFAPGVYDVTLVVTSIGGGTSSFTQPGIVTVNGAPGAGFTSSTNGSTVDFTNTSLNATSYIWNFGDASNSTDENPSHTYLNDGVYTVTLLATNNCGTTILEQTVVVSTPPTAAFTASGSTGCTPFAVQLTNASSSNATSFLWDFPGGTPSSSTEVNPSVIWNTAGVYTVTLTAFNAAGSSSSTTTITVNTAPTAGFTYQIGGLTAIFNNISLDGTSYSWNFGDGSAPDTEANPSHTYSQPGTYVVLLSVANDCGTVTTTQNVVVEGASPVPAISANNTVGCLPFSAQFTDQSAGDPTAWSWTFQGGTPASSTEENPFVSYSAPGTYDVVLEVTNIFGTSTQTFPGYITVQPPPTATFTFVANQLVVSFTSVVQNATTYSWNFGDGGSSTEQNPTHTYTNPGTYNVFLAVSNNCGTFLVEQIVVITSGTGEASWIEGFRLFPNPNTGSFTVEMNGLPQDEVEFVLFNMLGQHIRRETMDFGTGSMLRNFDYGDLAAGVYTLRIQAAGQAMFVKVTVSR